jgi:ribose transport system ATP-binding protein
LIVSSDFEELAHVCDCVLVLRDGRITARAQGPEISAHRITELLHVEER